MPSRRQLAYICSGLALLFALGWTVASYTGYCPSSCTGTKDYRLFGLPFELPGMVYFVGLLFFWALHWRRALAAGLAGGLGAELYFVYIQREEIGVWCPVCLVIAGSLLVSALLFTLSREKFQVRIQSMLFFVLGLLSALTFVTKESALEAAQTDLAERLVLGNEQSEIDAIFFTDWACQACHKLEARLDDVMKELEAEARVQFVDVVIHAETLNYMPFNLSFMIYNKEDYIELRHALTELAKVNPSPQAEDVSQVAAQVGVSYTPLPFADVAMGMQHFEELQRQVGVRQTPTLVLVNRRTSKQEKLVGHRQITPKNVRTAIKKLKR